MPDSLTIQPDDTSQPARGLLDNSEDPESLAYRPSPFFFGLGTLGITIVGETFGAFAYFYYVDFLGLTLALYGLYLLRGLAGSLAPSTRPIERKGNVT